MGPRLHLGRRSWLPNTVGLVSYLEKQPPVSLEDASGEATPLRQVRDQLCALRKPVSPPPSAWLFLQSCDHTLEGTAICWLFYHS